MQYVFSQLLLFLTEADAEAEAVAEEESGVGLLLPATEELIAGIVAFAIVFFFVWKFAIPVLNKTLEARQQAIKGELDAAESAKVEAQNLLTDYQQQLAGAKTEATQIVEDARESGDQVKADIVDRAETEAEEIKDRARSEMEAERDQVTGDLRRQVADLSIDVAEKVVGTSLDDERQRELIDRYIDDLGGVH
jgi:F-type H+-transporting ATPase subunit b